MYSSTFTFAAGAFDEAFHSLDAEIAAVARSIPGYLGEESRAPLGQGKTGGLAQGLSGGDWPGAQCVWRWRHCPSLGGLFGPATRGQRVTCWGSSTRSGCRAPSVSSAEWPDRERRSLFANSERFSSPSHPRLHSLPFGFLTRPFHALSHGTRNSANACAAGGAERLLDW
jgi:hypothetical protein